jgi:methionyl-tRNA formyltransferase
MKILFIGAVEFSFNILEELLGLEAKVVGAISPLTTDIYSDYKDIQSLCTSNQIPLQKVDNINSKETIVWINSLEPDVIFCMGWARLLKKELLSTTKLGVVGFHPSELPKNRGRHPIIWPLVLGLERTASTFFFMDEGADSGDIISQSLIEILPEDNSRTLYDKVTNSAIDQLGSFLPELISGKIDTKPQNHEISNTWRKRTKVDGYIDWRMSNDSIHNLIRALTKPYPGASFFYQGEEYNVFSSSIEEVGSIDNIEYGKILEINESGILVKCGKGSIRLKEIYPEPQFLEGEYL